MKHETGRLESKSCKGKKSQARNILNAPWVVDATEAILI